MVDEAHERSISTDILLGLLKKVSVLATKIYKCWQKKLKVVIFLVVWLCLYLCLLIFEISDPTTSTTATSYYLICYNWSKINVFFLSGEVIAWALYFGLFFLGMPKFYYRNSKNLNKCTRNPFILRKMTS